MGYKLRSTSSLRIIATCDHCAWCDMVDEPTSKERHIVTMAARDHAHRKGHRVRLDYHRISMYRPKYVTSPTLKEDSDEQVCGLDESTDAGCL